MNDRERWNAKYAGASGRREDAPDSFVEACLRELAGAESRGPGARALDFAAGSGRHALALARAGYEVEAWDVSDVGLERLGERARAASLVLTTRCIDLLREAWGVQCFELVVVVNFLDRDLLPRLRDLAAPGGVLCYATFTVDWPGAKPPPAFRLRRGELAGGIPGWKTLKVVEAGGRAGFLGRRAGD